MGKTSHLEQHRLLIAEDEPDLRAIMVELISDELGYEIKAVANGLEALQEIENGFNPHLILSDIGMPQMNGLELLHKILEKGVNTSFMFLTAYADQNKILTALQGGAVDYLIKPFKPDELIKKVNIMMEVAVRKHESNRLLLQSQNSEQISSDDIKQISQNSKMERLLKLKNTGTH